eukprot:673263-Pelagomonas_calceolata.AAC.3
MPEQWTGLYARSMPELWTGLCVLAAWLSNGRDRVPVRAEHVQVDARDRVLVCAQDVLAMDKGAAVHPLLITLCNDADKWCIDALLLWR